MSHVITEHSQRDHHINLRTVPAFRLESMELKDKKDNKEVESWNISKQMAQSTPTVQ